MTGNVLRAASLLYLVEPRAMLVDERLHAIAIGEKIGGLGVNVRVKAIHLPAATVCLEPAGWATPDSMHAIHVGAAAFTLHRIFATTL